MILTGLVKIGIGIKTATYFKFIYTILAGIDEYGVVRVAYFGMN